MILAFTQVFLVIIPVIVPFFQSKGLSMQQVFLLQALFGGIVVLMEIPSGYVADRLGRKGALVVGALVMGLCPSTLLFASDFTGLALFEALLGVAVSLISGADLALLYDTELALGRQGEAPQAVRNLHVAQSIAEGLAAVVCSLLVVWSMQAVSDYFAPLAVSPSGDPALLLKNLPWFAWPALPLVLWTLWTRGRGFNGGLATPGVQLPGTLSLVMAISIAVMAEPRAIVLMPLLVPLCLLGALEIDTLKRGFSGALDWFGMLTFGLVSALVWWLWFDAYLHGMSPAVAKPS